MLYLTEGDISIDTTLNTHLIKNSEWGAVAYLTQSIYGKCTSSTSCSEIGVNNYRHYTTGIGVPAGSISSFDATSTYETYYGTNLSTTGNIYDVYDMSGGALGGAINGLFKFSTKMSTGNSFGGADLLNGSRSILTIN